MRSAPSVITERGFGSEAAIRRGDRHRRGSVTGSREGRRRGRAETDEVRTLGLDMGWTGMRTTRTAGRWAAPLRNAQKRTRQ